MTCLQTTIAIRSTRNEGAFIRRQHDHTIKLKSYFRKYHMQTRTKKTLRLKSRGHEIVPVPGGGDRTHFTPHKIQIQVCPLLSSSPASSGISGIST